MSQELTTYPDLMAGKTLLYVHGFGSSGQSGTVSRMRMVMPRANVVAPDLPLHPQAAIDLLRQTCEELRPHLIIGTSMGGMYAEMLYGYDRILTNPAFEMGDTMVSHNMVGAQQFQNPRLDGVQQFIVTKALVREYKEMTQHCFAHADDPDEQQRVVGLFGDEDTTVDTFDLFQSHYPQAIRFHGAHRMDDRSFMHSVMPVVRWIDDRQQGRQRPIVYIAAEALIDRWGKPQSSAQKAVRMLIERYQVYFYAPAPTNDPDHMAHIMAWMQQHINVPAYNHVIFTNQPQLLYGDYLIAPSPTDTLATHIPIFNDTFKTWEEVIDYFQQLGGQ